MMIYFQTDDSTAQDETLTTLFYHVLCLNEFKYAKVTNEHMLVNRNDE